MSNENEKIYKVLANATQSFSNAEKATARDNIDALGTNDVGRTAITNNYNDLNNKPDLSIYAKEADLATVAISGSYNDLTNKPNIPASKAIDNVFIGFDVDTTSAVGKITVNTFEFLNSREYHLFFYLKASIELSSYTKSTIKLRYYIGGVNYPASPWKMTVVVPVDNGVAKLNTSILPFNWKGEGIIPELETIANYLQIDFVDVDNDTLVYMASGQFINVVIRGTESY